MIFIGLLARPQWAISACQGLVLVALKGVLETSSPTRASSAHPIPQLDHHTQSCSGPGAPSCAPDAAAPALIR
jgi:hypothetical protein